MDLNEIKTYIDTNKDNEEVKSYIGGFTTADRVDTFLNTDDGKKLLQPKLDSYHGKGLETWKTNNLQKLIDEGIALANPAETKEQKTIRDLTDRLNKSDAEKLKGGLTKKALKLLNDKKLTDFSDLIDNFTGEDEVATSNTLTKLESIVNKRVETIVNERLKGGYKPPIDGGNGTVFTKEQISKMTSKEINDNWKSISETLKK